ncbi:MAG: hypothetical protein A2V67_09185 [Deltaproteobacteria bacterium RBG_13_61_14]|nr:MAG: hypothetical protein A2V67_09185 [Deltaproteobacteria bacterium RBG_13_61_14]
MTPMYPNIPKVDVLHRPLDKGNLVQYWGFFSADELARNQHALLMMDIDLGRKCSLRCPSCFRKSNPVDDYNYPDLKYEQIMAVLEEAKTLGLREIKICGAGEPLEDSRLLPFARDLTAMGLGLSIFTKGHVLGDDNHVTSIYGKYGIDNAVSLCEEFFRFKTSFLVGFQSAHPEIQDKLVGDVKGYTLKRNRALEILADIGFNKTSPTRLAICANPIMSMNYGELFNIYVYARRRNILPVNAALMVSGKQIDTHFLAANDVSAEEKELFFIRVYRYNLEHGIQSKGQMLTEGISCLVGIHPCNQIAAGVYLTCNGTVIRCPGDSGNPLGNIHEQTITEIWEANKQWRFAGMFNCHCPFKDGVTLPEGIYSRVLDRVLNDQTALLQLGRRECHGNQEDCVSFDSN